MKMSKTSFTKRMRTMVLSTIFSTVLIMLLVVACSSNNGSDLNKEGFITKSTDNGELGEMRQVIEEAADHDTITFARNINPKLTGNAVNIMANYLSIKGNKPETTITRNNSSNEPILAMKDGLGYGLTLENMSFFNIYVDVGNITTNGGAIVCVVNYFDDTGARFGDMFGSSFFDNRVTLGNSLNGGSMLGTSTNKGVSSIGNVNAVFSDNRLVLTNIEQSSDRASGRIWGAGLLGSYSELPHSSLVGNINGEFSNNTVSAASYINGGGLIGAFVGIDDEQFNPDAYLPPHNARVGNVNADFNNNFVISKSLSGGGMVGSWSFMATTSIGDIIGEYKNNIVLVTEDYLRGGGMIGLRTYTEESLLGHVTASFSNNSITVAQFMGGGGIIGLYSARTLTLGNRELDKTSTIERIDGSSFTNNTVHVGNSAVSNVYALSGVIAVSGLNQELTIHNTTFQNNKLYITGANIWDIGAGAFYISTDRNSNNSLGHVLTLTASGGATTEFRNNTLTINNDIRSNSITFGREWDSLLNAQLDSKADAVLNIQPTALGSVALLDPIKIDMNNGKSFIMNINSADNASFVWGGKNDLYADNSVLNFNSGMTTLNHDFQVVGNYDVVLAQNHNLIINVNNRANELPIFNQPNSLTVQGTPSLYVYPGADSQNGDEWLITNKRHGLDETSFTTESGFSLRVDGENLYVRISR